MTTIIDAAESLYATDTTTVTALEAAHDRIRVLTCAKASALALAKELAEGQARMLREIQRAAEIEDALREQIEDLKADLRRAIASGGTLLPHAVYRTEAS